MAPTDLLMQKLQGWWMHSIGRSLKATLACLLPLLICWDLWKGWNTVVFENLVASSDQVYRQVFWTLSAIAAAHPFQSTCPEDKNLLHLGFLSTLMPPKPTMLSTLVWSLLVYPYVKLNVDGSSIGNSRYSGG